jgi:hypothetical protein
LSIGDDADCDQFFRDIDEFIKNLTRVQGYDDPEIVPNIKTTDIKIRSLKKNKPKKDNSITSNIHDHIDMIADMVAITHFCSYGLTEMSIKNMPTNAWPSREYGVLFSVLNTFMPYINNISVKSDVDMVTITISDDDGEVHTLKRDLFLTVLTSPHLFRI